VHYKLRPPPLNKSLVLSTPEQQLILSF